jgi:hypothetical protein
VECVIASTASSLLLKAQEPRPLASADSLFSTGHTFDGDSSSPALDGSPAPAPGHHSAGNGATVGAVHHAASSGWARE